TLRHRRKIADFYQKKLKELGFFTVELKSWEDPIFLRYPVRVQNKSEVLQKAAKLGIELGSWFDSPLHPVESPMPVFGYQSGTCPVAKQICSEVINLPTHRRISHRQAIRTIEFLKRYALPIDVCNHKVDAVAL
ncbi:DegT/DnrJ/EryC1/StrS family aminotransferase, partial [bacterium]|nr:DegT/DnrJ/EryC1/StrS family aminotransferase [bacterium]